MKKLTFVFLAFINFSIINAQTDSLLTGQDSLTNISISVVGDLMCHTSQYEVAQIDKDSFDFNVAYELVKDHLSSSDFTFGNLETVLGGKERAYSGYPNFNSPDDYVTALKNAGFDFLTTSNNHSLDKGEKGLLRTLEVLKQHDLHYNGTYSSPTDRDSVRMINIKGIKVAFLAYTFSTNGIAIPKGKPYLINMLDWELIKKDIKNAKLLKPDLILVHYHYGTEYVTSPTAQQTAIIDKTIELGADIIIGGHPHVLQPIKYFNGKGSLDIGFVAYSMGNFYSGQRKRYTDAGMILTLNITKNINSNSITVSSVDYIPTYVYRGMYKGKDQYVILPINEETMNLDFIDSSIKTYMKQTLNDTKGIVEKHIKIK